MPGIENLFMIILYLILGGVAVYLVYWLVGMLTLPAPVKTAISILIAVIIIWWILSVMGVV